MDNWCGKAKVTYIDYFEGAFFLKFLLNRINQIVDKSINIYTKGF